MDTLQGRAGDSHAVDIVSLSQQLTQELAFAEASSQQHFFGGPGAIIIAKVSSNTRNVDWAGYEPQHVSIGPYSNPGLARDDEKIRNLSAVLSAASAATGATLELFLNELASLEALASGCYAHSFGMDSATFVRMLLLDACYLLVRFGDVGGAAAPNGHVQGGGGYHHHVGGRRGGDQLLESVAVVRDVFYLAENQIPFVVINKVHQLTTSMDSGNSAAEAIERYVKYLLKEYSVATPQLSPPEPGNLLHLLHMHFKPADAVPSPSSSSPPTHERVDRWRTATDYYFFADVKFEKRLLRPDGARCILDVRLKGSVLEIPRLNIDAETWRLLRNLMALEQHNPEATGSNVTAYCVFMSQLACTPFDVELLSRSGVIAHGLGNNAEVADCFADLCKGIVFSVNDQQSNYLWTTCLALDKRFRSRHRRWMAWLRQNYFRNPWLAAGLAAAVVGLVCTVVQAVYSVLSYKQGAR